MSIIAIQVNRLRSLLPLSVIILAALPAAFGQCQNINPDVFVAGPPCVSIESIANSPAATLLLPYFEVDLANPAGKNTVFTITDTASPAALAHITLWSELGVPVLNFDVYLTGYDTQVINLRSILSGTLPRTASAGQDFSDTISPVGNLSQDINLASCTGVLPYAPLTPAVVQDLAAALTGGPTVASGGKCAATNHGDRLARGYVTIDTVQACNIKNPGDSDYLNFFAIQTNRLTGEVYYLSANIARADNLVHIHADASNALTNTSGKYTFYGALDGFTAVDHRQPLPTNFAARFMNDQLGPAGGGSGNRLQQFTPTGGYIWQLGGTGSTLGKFNSPSGVNLMSNGNIVVADTGNNRIQVFNSSGNVLYTFGSAGATPGKLNGPTGVLVLPNGNIAVADTGNNRIQVFTAAGNYQYQFGTAGTAAGQFSGPQGLALASNGNLLITDGATTDPATSPASLIVWRDSKLPQAFFTCGSTPAPFPLGTEGVLAFDEQEHVQTIAGSPFPFATQVVPIGGAALPVSYASGWVKLNLNTAVTPAAGPTADLNAAQGWVQVLDQKLGTLHTAQQLDSGTKAVHQ